MSLYLSLQDSDIAMNWALWRHERQQSPGYLLVELQQPIDGFNHGLLLDVHVVSVLLTTLEPRRKVVDRVLHANNSRIGTIVDRWHRL